jgi:Fur family ferric uptake transcriptional regulator
VVGYGAMITEMCVGIMALIAACAMAPGEYFAINMKGEPAAVVAKVTALGCPVTTTQMADLAASGDADALQSKDGELLYRACTTDHHHHLICRACGKTIEIEAERVEKWADEVAKEHGFTQPSHTIDIFGTCSSCQ